MAPYNESMRLGQGYNSFLQSSCIDNAIHMSDSESVINQPALPTEHNGASQTITCSTRLLEKPSDPARALGVSAAACIKDETIPLVGNGTMFSSDETSENTITMVVSVKVVNQITKIAVSEGKFVPPKDAGMTTEQFIEVYGDSYISGFVEGGELHGLISVKVVDDAQRKEVEKYVNELNESISAGTYVDSVRWLRSFFTGMSGLETTVNVDWTGGGQIKPEDEEWSLDLFLKTTASFPSKITGCPQRTRAILSKYNQNRSFEDWANRRRVVVPNYQAVESYMFELLDMHMQYKQNLTKLNAIFANPQNYKKSAAENAIGLSVSEMMKERKKMREEMVRIVGQVEELCVNPDRVEEMIEKSKIRSPWVWATRLPIPL